MINNPKHEGLSVSLTKIFGGFSFLATPVIAITLLAGFGCASDSSQPGGHAPAVQPAAETKPAAVTTPLTEIKENALTLVTARPALKVVRADSEETAAENGRAANAVDGDPATLWHTRWQDATPECPHEIVIELTPAATLKGFTYLPRQDDSENGMIKGYEFYVSNDGQDFGQPVARGEFENNKSLKSVTFAPQLCRFIKLRALSEVNDGAWTSAAEIGVLQ
jgi:hypothetical protein